jgi:hypothetical protein
MKKRKIKIGGIYKHYKGYLMKVLGEVKHSETNEEMVLYIHLGDGQLWVRPKMMFLEKIDKANQKIYRFRLIK